METASEVELSDVVEELKRDIYFDDRVCFHASDNGYRAVVTGYEGDGCVQFVEVGLLRRVGSSYVFQHHGGDTYKLGTPQNEPSADEVEHAVLAMSDIADDHNHL